MFAKYEMDGLFDEMFERPGDPRAHYQGVYDLAAGLTADSLQRRRRRMADVAFRNQGITFTVYGDETGVERIFPFDLMPRIIPAAEWDVVERCLVQRITALNLFCHDVYFDQHILREKIIPPEMIYSAKFFRREMIGLEVPRQIYVHICGTDLVRHDANPCLVRIADPFPGLGRIRSDEQLRRRRTFCKTGGGSALCGCAATSGLYKGSAKEAMTVTVESKALKTVPTHLAGERVRSLDVPTYGGWRELSLAGQQLAKEMQEQQQQ